MLEPHERTSFLDALRPPFGYRLDAAFGTAFSLDFHVLTAVMLAFVDAEIDEEDSRQDPAIVVQAITRLSRRVRIFVNRGSIRFDGERRANRLFALFDRIVRDVALADASFHPKVWVLKYRAKQSPEFANHAPIYRLVCSSRNLSLSRSWEIGLRLEAAREGRPSPMARALATFCSTVLAQDHPPPRELTDLASEIQGVSFAASREMADSLEFIWQWPGRARLERYLPAKGRRVLIMAPFVRSSFIDILLDRFQHLILISTQEELDALSDAMHQRLASAEIYVVNPRETGTGELALDLHGKLLMVEAPGADCTFLGSANASSRAWGLGGSLNCEAMVAMAPGLGIDRFLKAFVRGPEGPHAWIDLYQRNHEPPDEIEAARQALSKISCDVARIEVVVRYDRNAAVLHLSAQGPPRSALPEAWSRYAIDLAPLLLVTRGEEFRSLTDLLAGEAAYPQVEPSDVSEFVVLRLTDRQHQNLVHSCVLRAQSNLDDALREWRNDAIRAHLLANSDLRVLLWNILWGPGSRPGDQEGGTEARGVEGRHHHSLLSEATIEQIIEACTEDPSRIEDIDALLRAFKDNPTIDSAFREFWDRFKRAHALLDQEAPRA